MTEKVIAANVAALLVYELYLAATGQQLLSRAVWAMSKKYPWVAFAAGILSAHFWIDIVGD